MLPIKQILEISYFDNTVDAYLEALGILFGTYFLGKIITFFLNTKGRKLAERTKSLLDDEIVKISINVVDLGVFLLGIYLASASLNLPEKITTIIGTIVIVLISIKVIRAISEFINFSTKNYIIPLAKRNDVDRDLIKLFAKITKILIWVLGAITITSYLGYDLTGLVAGLGIGGLAIALAAQETLGNFISSISIFMDRPFKVGDWVLIDDIEGSVTDIGIRSTTIATFYGTVKIIPNTKVAQAIIENYQDYEILRAEQSLFFRFETPMPAIEKAIEIINKVYEDHPSITRKRVNFTEYDQKGLKLQIQYWISDASDWDTFLKVKNDCNLAIKKEMDKENISQWHVSMVVSN